MDAASIPNTFDVLFVGTGVSVGVPSLEHLQLTPHACALCEEAYANPSSKNRRNNVSIALIVPQPSADPNPNPNPNPNTRCVLVDCGKTFRDAALSHFRSNGITEIHSVLYTHEHADAMEGSDDLRDFQRKEQIGLAYHVRSGPLTLYMTSFSANTFQGKFPYLTRRPPFIDASQGILERNVAWIKMEVIEDTAQFVTHDVPVRCFPVLHGGSYVSLGFNFGLPGEFVYISDVKVVPPESMEYLTSLPTIKVLVVDCLNPATHEHFAHFNLTEALEFVRLLNPVKAYLVGMCCRCGDHDTMNEEIRAMGISNVELAFDGMRLNGLTRK